MLRPISKLRKIPIDTRWQKLEGHLPFESAQLLSVNLVGLAVYSMT